MKTAKKTGKRTKALRVLVTILIVGALLYLGQVLYLLRADSPRGFVLPEGNSAKGKAAFVALNCVQCHTVYGIDLPTPPADQAEEIVTLGGPRQSAKTYGQIVTSIMHPSADIYANEGRYVNAEGASLMPDYKSEMTVEQLVNIVTFLQAHYEFFVPDYDPRFYYAPYNYITP